MTVKSSPFKINFETVARCAAPRPFYGAAIAAATPDHSELTVNKERVANCYGDN